MRLAVLGFVALGGCYNLQSPTEESPPVVWTPPTNTWELTPPPEGLVGEGFAVGDVVDDVRLADQFEDEVSLWQFYGKVVVLDVSTIWCSPCQELAETTQETYEDYEPDGFMYITVLQEDLHNENPETDDLLFWATEYGISTPVLDDGDDPRKTSDALALPNTWPAVLVIDREMVVHERVDPPEDAELRAAIEAGALIAARQQVAIGCLLAFAACRTGDGDADVTSDNTGLVLSPVGVVDDDHSTIVHVTWSTPESLPGWVEFGLDGAFDKKSPAITASDHVHQLRGLKAGRTYSWRVVVQEGDDLVTSDAQIVDVEAVPQGLPTFSLVTLDPSADMADAYLTVAGAQGEYATEDPAALFYVGIVDAEGDFVWYHTLPVGRGTSALEISRDLSSVWWMDVDNFREDLAGNIIRMTLDGTVLSETLADTGHHAAIELSGGRFAHLGRTFEQGAGTETLMTDRVLIATEGDRTGATAVEIFDYMQDWWAGDSDYPWSQGKQVGEVYGYHNVTDLTHSNSIAWSEEDNAIYPFARILDTLLKIDVDTGALEWQMSGLHSDFTFPDGKSLYEGPFEAHLWSSGHYSQIWHGGLTMFDNGNNYNPQVSSIIEVTYDEEAGTAEEVFRFEDTDNGWTGSLGDVWKLPSGHYVASWMTLSKLTEVTPDGDVVWRLDPEGGTAVRRIRPITDLYSLTPLASLPPPPP